jgi:hypothetical protein
LDQISFGPEVAAVLLQKVGQVRLSGLELSSFSDREPFLAAECGVEISALEVRSILGSGSVDRICVAAESSRKSGMGFAVSRADMELMNRMEGVIALASSRIAQKYMALEAADSSSSKLGSAISVVSGIAGLIKTFF